MIPTFFGSNFSSKINLRLFERLLFLGTICFFILKILRIDDYSWDVVAYHLPFTALKSGIINIDQYSMSPHLSEAYLGFPDFIYYIKGFLWKITGNASAANLVNILAILTFGYFCSSALKIRFFWSTMILLAIPILHVAISSGMVDLIANIFLTISLCSVLLFIIEKQNGKILYWFYASAFLAAGTKAQAVPFTGLMLAVAFVFKVSLDIRNKRGFDYKFWIIFFLAAVAIMHKPLSNMFVYGNPLYPVKINILGLELPGVFVPIWPDPQYLANYPQSVRWILSVLEFDAFSMRPVPYTVDQGEVPSNSRSFRMGGYNGFLVLFSLIALAWVAFKIRMVFVYWVIIFVVTSGLIISFLPGSNELRYYSFWMIFLVVSTMYVCEKASSINVLDGEIFAIKKIYKVVVLLSIVYFIMITGGRYQKISAVNYEGFVLDRISSKIEMNDGFCIYGDESRFSILVAIEMNLVRNEKMKIYQRQSVEACGIPNLLEQ